MRSAGPIMTTWYRYKRRN